MILKAMREVGIEKQVERKKKGVCPFCSVEVDPESFRDDVSWREYTISGCCQECQDDFFE